jgi:hypothetical protein
MLEGPELPLHSVRTVHLHSHVIHQGCSGEQVGTVLSLSSHQALWCVLSDPLRAVGLPDEVQVVEQVQLLDVLVVAPQVLVRCLVPRQN